jgi:hypothetical protein
MNLLMVFWEKRLKPFETTRCLFPTVETVGWAMPISGLRGGLP